MVRRFRYLVLSVMTAGLMLGLCGCGGNQESEENDAKAQRTEGNQAVGEKPQAEGNQAAGEEAQAEGNRAAGEEVQAVENQAAGEESQTEGNETLVVYFSATGTTKGVAEKIADITNADIAEIVPAKSYSSEDLDYNDKQSRTSVEMNDPDARPEIGSERIPLENYSVLYLGYPIWWGEAPRIMSTFVESYDFDGITVIPFCTSGGSSIGKSGEVLAEQAGSGTWLSGERWNGGASEEELQSWIDGL